MHERKVMHISHRQCCLKLLISQVGLQAYAAAGFWKRNLLAAVIAVRFPCLKAKS